MSSIPFWQKSTGCSGGHDLVDDVPDHSLLFVQECLELVGAGDIDLGVDLGLLELHCGVEQQDLGVLDLLGHGGVHTLFVHQHALDDLGVVDGTADLLLHLDVVLVHGAVFVGHHGDRLDDKLAELLLGGL